MTSVSSEDSAAGDSNAGASMSVQSGKRSRRLRELKEASSRGGKENVV
eukprot:CAMPEP_0117052740 /NCGR_PEP_ID=MMETSP0472-20121206/36457_1 /TAXON_ID=693140 ORGANISM="Tiarina fusus, Strain LIS" /NCGR_SAMPLE_ID=MMETSP0472 /ASSEMBLY_ACC=CAM_ASM_000603 /LENGTH=47 /DNA_ID= /DNA_START= /DNA_END= /DNA_ORIENTATION=